MADVILLKINGVDGETQHKGFEKQIELLSFSHGVSMQVTGDTSNQARTSGKPNHQDFQISKYLDVTTPKLNQKCCEGSNLGDAIITIARNDGGTIMELMKYTLKNTIISSVSVGGGGGDKPVENVSFNYSAIAWDYTSQKESSGKLGNAGGTWDVALNQAK